MTHSKTMRRFYETAAVDPVERGYAVVLDGRTVKTQQTRDPVVVPTRALAEAVAAEWADQGETVDPRRMPLTSLAMTALDTAVPRREALIDGLARYAETDVVCYRVPHPEALAQREQAHWQPLLDWLALTHDARLNTTTGILPVEQPADALHALRNAVAAHDAMHLAALSSSVRATGSLVIGLALIAGRLDAEGAFAAAEVEQTHEIEQWGMDTDQETRRAGILDDLTAAERFVGLLAAG